MTKSYAGAGIYPNAVTIGSPMSERTGHARTESYEIVVTRRSAKVDEARDPAHGR
jgi:hypothetical protein